MSLRINGLDMPKACINCDLRGVAWGNYKCTVSGEIIKNELNRPNDCPLSEIPTPHGKLIDTDAAIARLKYLYCDGCGCDCSTCQWGAFIKYLDGRPTIIEAEKYGEVS